MTVSYNSSNLLVSMLASVPNVTPVVIVDNGSEDSEALMDLEKRPNTHIIYNKINVGFGAACNIGAKFSKTEFILFLNPDCRLEIDTIEKLLLAASKYPELVAANPLFEDRKGKVSFKRKSSLVSSKLWYRNRYLSKIVLFQFYSAQHFLLEQKNFIKLVDLMKISSSFSKMMI